MEVCQQDLNPFQSVKYFEEIYNPIQNLEVQIQTLGTNISPFFNHIQEITQNLLYHELDFDSNEVYRQLDLYKNELLKLNSELAQILLKWKIRQQEFSVGCINENDCYNQQLKDSLNLIDGCFSLYCGIVYGICSRSKEILSWIDNCKNNLNPYNPSAHKINLLTNIQESVQMFANFNQELMGNLFKDSIIVSKQPPSIITMFEQRSFNTSQNNGDNKKRRSRFWFDTELRLLGAQAWKQVKEINIFGVTAGVRLLTEDVGEKFVIEPNHANFDVLTDSAPFNDMRILKSEKRPRGVKDRRYAIVYEVNASHFGTIYKMSLPFSIVNGEPDFEKDTDAFIERSFADLAFQISREEEALNQGNSLTFDTYQKQLNLKNISLATERVVEALELKFRRIFEKRDSDKERDDDKEKVQHRVFNQKDKEHIAHMLQLRIPGHLSQKGLECNCRLCQNIKERQQQDPEKIFLNALTDHVIAMKLVTHNGSIKPTLEACTFIEWFYKIAEMASVLRTYWTSNEVFGFCDQTTTEAMLIMYPGKILIRFADTMLGQLRLSMKDGSNLQRTRHITIKYTENSKNCDLDTFNDERQFFNIVKTAARQYGIYYIYPDFTINMPEINEDQPDDCTEYNKNTYTINDAKKHTR